MKLTKLEICRTASYASPPNQLVGLLELTGSTGQQQITLSAGAITRLIQAIATEVAATARQNAKLTAGALQEAQDEILLIETDGSLSA